MARNLSHPSAILYRASGLVQHSHPRTIAYWWRPATLGAYQYNVSWDAGSQTAGDYWGLRTNPSGGTEAITIDSGGGGGWSLAPGVVSIGNWVHQAGTFGSLSKRIAYLNGVPGNVSTSPAGPPGALRLVVGCLWNNQYTSPGDYAEIALWLDELTPEEIGALAKGVSPLLIRPSALWFYYPCLQPNASGTLEPDRWRDNFDLNISNAPNTAPHPRIFYPAIHIAADVTTAGHALAASSTFHFSATPPDLIAPIGLQAASTLSFASTALLSAAPAQFTAASLFTFSATAHLALTPRLAASSGFRFSSTASFLPPSLFAASAYSFASLATINPSPRESQVSITIDGVDVRPRVRMKALEIHDILNDAPNTCRLVIEGDGPAVGQALRITINEGSRVLFAGEVQSVDHSFELQPDQLAWSVSAIDDTMRANAKRPFGTWVDTSATTIAQAITTHFAPGFSTAGIAPDLPKVSIVLDGGDTMIAALSRLATLIGGYCKVEDGTIYLFIEDTTAAPDPIDAAHCFMHTPAIRSNTDESQLRTRVYGKGYGEAIQADVAAGESLLPIENGGQFPPFGGGLIASTTPDGAQSERFQHAGVELAGGGTLVGSGAGPTVAPLLGLAGGVGVTAGRHDVAVVFVTASGKSLAGPIASIDVGVLAPPAVAPIAAAAISGTGPDQGSHDYVASFVTAFGETTPSPVSNAVTASSAVGQVGAPGSPTATASQNPGPQPSNFSAQYQVTFVTPVGETEGGALTGAGATSGPGPPQMFSPPVSGQMGTAPGGNMTPGASYRYFFSHVTASGYETALGNVVDFIMPSNHGSWFANVFVPHPDPRVTKRRIYRTGANGTLPANGQGGYLVAEQPNDTRMWTDTASDASISGGEVYTFGQGPRGPDPGCQVQVTNIPIGPAGVTGRKLYRRVNQSGTAKLVTTIGNNTATAYTDAVLDASLGADIPTSNTTGTAVQRIPVSNIPLGGAGVIARKLYRRFNGAGTFKLVTTLANNTATAFTDAVPNTGLGAAALTTPTAIGHQVAVEAIPIGAGAVTARELYMSPVGQPTRKLALVIGNNTATTATITASDATLNAAPAEPLADTSGLQQPQGQVNPGSTSLPVAAASSFLPTGGWVLLAGGQVVRYTGLSGQNLIGIPPEGPGAITTTVLYGSQALPAPMLVGVTGLATPLAKGSAVHLWIQRDDLQAQAEHAARTGGDGIVEYVLVDMRRGVDSLTARCDAELALFARPIVTVTYATRDLKTRSGKLVTVNLTSPRIQEVLTIQEVTITGIDIVPGLAPRFTVTASSVRFSLADTLRRLVSGGLIVGGSS